jgi:beta-galactosidase
MQRQNLSRRWRFHLSDIAASRWDKPDDSQWRVLDLPHDWSIELARDPKNISGTSGGYFPMGHGWYHKTLALDESWQDKKISVEFEGVYMNAAVWLDHHCLGRHPYGYTSFTFDLTPYIDWSGTNTLKVYADNTHQLNSRWYSGSGIYRPVWLIVADPVHVAHWGVYITTPEISDDSSTANIRTRVENESSEEKNVTLRTHIVAPDGSRVTILETGAVIENGSTHEFQSELFVPNPQLWSPDTPHLYQAKTTVLVNGTVTDTETTVFGIRSIEFSAEKGFLLNGERVLLKGGCVHHDNGILGAASYPRSEERKVEIHKANGYNAIRCAHNPPSPSFLDACDRLGMLVIDEAFDCWRDGKNTGDYHVAFDDWWQRDLDAMLYRDRNHPSIILWSIGNEVTERDGYGEGCEISRMLAEYVRKIDPTRPVTAAICSSWRGDPWEIMDPAFATLDVCGYNYQWAQHRPDHERLPDRIMMGTESFPLEAFENWQTVEEIPAVVGDFVWTSLDYLGESGIGRVHADEEDASSLGTYPWHQANCGDLDLCGFKRPQSYYRDLIWHDDPRITIVVHPPHPEGKTPGVTLWGWPDVWPNWNWPGQEGQTFKVEIYANCEQVELFLDNQSLGRKPCSRQEKFRAEFDVGYAPGELSAIGYIAGKPVAEKVLSTTGEPAQIQLIADRETIQAGGFDLCYITVKVTDDEGRLHPTADNDIFFTINGPGKILAVGNSNPVSEELYVGNQRKVHRGRAMVVIKSTNEPGEIHLTAQADGLEGAKIITSSESQKEK